MQNVQAELVTVNDPDCPGAHMCMCHLSPSFSAASACPIDGWLLGAELDVFMQWRLKMEATLGQWQRPVLLEKCRTSTPGYSYN